MSAISTASKQLCKTISTKTKAMFKTMWQDFTKFVKTNPQYLACSVLYWVIASIVLGGVLTSFLVALLSYILSLFIAFTPIGEKLLRGLEHVRRIETKQEKEYLLPLFQEVYMRAKEHNPKLEPIELCIIDRMIVNACALGKGTIAVTKGAIATFSKDELKAIMAHEIAHILYGDTMARLYTTVGNGIFTVFVLAAKAFIFIAELIEAILSKARFSFALILILIVKFLYQLIVIVISFLMQMMLSITSRSSEYRADRYAYELGYGEKLVQGFYLLEKIRLGTDATVIQKMTASHPRITARIERIETLLEKENGIQTAPLPLS